MNRHFHAAVLSCLCMGICMMCLVEIIGSERSSWIAWQRCSADSVEEAIVCKKTVQSMDLMRSISIPIAISIPKKRKPNKRMHWMLILRASDS